MSHISFDYVSGFVVFLSFVVLMAAKKLPSPEGFDHFLSALNSKGGNIVILTIFTYISFVQSSRMFYHLLEMVERNQLQQDNSFALMGLQFLTTSAFGLFAGALINTLTGATSAPKRSTDLPKPDGGNDVPKPEIPISVVPSVGDPDTAGVHLSPQSPASLGGSGG